MDDKKRVSGPMILGVFELLTVLATIAGLFVWNRAESREDMRHMETQIEAIRQDIKDFHGRLCAIEERRGK